MITCTTGQTVNIDTTKFLPDMGQAEFLKNIINTFNLYFSIDVNNKVINFETYDTLFMNKVNPYDVTDKVLSDKLVIENVENSDNSIEFKSADNMKVFGDNLYLASTDLSALDVTLRTSDENTNKKVFNYIGKSSNKIDCGFGVPAIKRMYLRNEKDYSGADFNAGDHIIFLPNISKQTPQDNDNKKFNKSDSDTTIFNTEETIQHKGNLSLYYYYGLSDSTFEQKPSIGYDKDYYYLNLDATPTKIPVVNPFLYQIYRDNVNYRLSNPTDDYESVLAAYVQTPYLMLGNDETKVTDFSLILNENSDYGETIYSKFHKNKYDRYRNSELLKFTMLINNVDWKNMTINQPIKFNNQIYSLVYIQNYDVVAGTAEVCLIKML